MTRGSDGATPRYRIILFAHGSRDPEWARPFEDLLRRAEERLGPDRVRLAFLGFRGPGLLEAAWEAARDGIEVLHIVPLFFSGGQHVRVDIPGLVALARRRNPSLDIRVAGSLSEDPGFREALLQRVLDVAEPLAGDGEVGGSVRVAGSIG